MNAVLPALKDVAQTLTALLGRPVSAASAKVPYRPTNSEATWLAVYRGLDGALAVVGLADLTFAAHSAAALAMFPVQRAEEAMRARKMDEQLEENFHEIMNVIATALSRAHGGLRLDVVVSKPLALPTDAVALLDKPRARMDVEIAITGYAKGKLSFLIP